MKNTIGKPLAALGMMAALMVATQAPAQSWRPDKNIEIIVGSSPGGSFDLTARSMQKILQDTKLVETPISVVNRPGGNNAVSWVYMNGHQGDGHYIALVFPTLITNRLMGSNPTSIEDVTPIAHLYSDYIAFAVRPDSRMKTARDVVAALRQDAQKVTMGLTAIGTAHQVTAARLAKAAGVDPKTLKFVVFKGAGDAKTAVLGGHIDVVISAPASFAADLEAGRLHVPFVTSPRRMSGSLAQVPTLKEQGYDIVVPNWRGMAGPKGMSRAQVAYWENVFARLSENPEWKATLAKYGWENEYMNSRDFMKFLESERKELAAEFAALVLLKQ
jgi:putative tricarboxylic transport membrane protein